MIDLKVTLLILYNSKYVISAHNLQHKFKEITFSTKNQLLDV